jgi:hypothetical protein
MPEFHKPERTEHTPESEKKENRLESRETRHEAEGPLPLINTEEGRFIENTGGEYRGFVKNESGRRAFEDVRITKAAYYDENRREIAEMFIATEAVNDEGGDELLGPSDVRGYSILIEKRSRTGDRVANSDIISLQPKDFIGRRPTAIELRGLARDVHDFLTQLPPPPELAQLRQRVEAHLRKEGWRDR